eukprot:Em0002g1125a
MYMHIYYRSPPQSGIQSTQELQASTSVINRDPNVQQSIASQQPTQFQNIAGPVQPIYGNPAGQPLYYVPGYPYPRQEYVQDPVKMAYANLPTQPHPTSFNPQLYGGNILSTPQQPYQPVILVQPTPVPICSSVRPTSGDNYLTLSVLMTFLVLLVGGWPSLLCTISALLVSFNAKEEEKRGNIAAARTKTNISLGLNIAAVMFVVVVWSVVAIPVAVTHKHSADVTRCGEGGFGCGEGGVGCGEGGAGCGEGGAGRGEGGAGRGEGGAGRGEGVLDVAKVVLDVGNVVLDVAKVVLDVAKVVLDVAKVVLDVAKVVLDVAKVVLDVAKVVLDVAKVVLDVGKVVLDVAKVVLDVAKVVLDVAKVVLDVAKVVLDVAKVVLDVGKVVLDVAKVVLDVAKVVLDVAKVVLDVGKVVLDVGKVVLDGVQHCHHLRHLPITTAF